METLRQPFQGVFNIIRFNWHFYVLAGLFSGILFFLIPYTPEFYHFYLYGLSYLMLISTIISLFVSFYIYDVSDLYLFKWLQDSDEKIKIVNINAGFDETSILLKAKFQNAELIVLDFYDPVTHTEVSIQRARKAYPPYPETQQVNTNHLPFQDNSIDKIFVTLAAHEIRDDAERIIFFKELNRIIKPSNEIFITEHLRDTANFLAYNIGFLHFLSEKIWLKVFRLSHLSLNKKIKITSFITVFILKK